MIMLCRGDAFAIMTSHKTAFKMCQAVKDRFDSKNPVNATSNLEKSYMKSIMDYPFIWILEMEILNRELINQKWKNNN